MRLCSFLICGRPAVHFGVSSFIYPTMKFSQILLLMLSLIISACASTPPEFIDLEPSKGKRTINLTKQITARQKVRLAEWEYGLAPGIYVPVAENSQGTLYRGPGRCVLLHHSGGYRISPGGVWVPKTSAQKFKIYVYAHQDFLDFKTIPEALAAQSRADLQGTDGNTPRIIVVTPQPSAGGVIAGGVASAILKSEIEKERGQPIPLFDIENDEVTSIFSK